MLFLYLVSSRIAANEYIIRTLHRIKDIFLTGFDYSEDSLLSQAGGGYKEFGWLRSFDRSMPEEISRILNGIWMHIEKRKMAGGRLELHRLCGMDRRRGGL